MKFDSPTFIDLFCGCGGFSLGLKQAGFSELGAIDFNPEAIKVFKCNFPETKNVLLEDLTKFEPSKFAEIIGTHHVDLVIGGPPCQGFSTVRQRDGSNSGERMVFDERRELYQYFLKYVGYFRPKIFIMENVLGIRSAAGGKFFSSALSNGRRLGYRVHGEIIKAWEYGVPQKRERQLIIGTRLELPLFSKRLFLPPSHSTNPVNGMEKCNFLGDAIDDLPPLDAGSGELISDYDLELRSKYLKNHTGKYLFDVVEIEKAKKLTSHFARPHNSRDLRDFSRLREGETSAHAIARGLQMEFPYDRKSFKDRYTRQNSQGFCSTIVAHLSKDGLMFIHPKQNRTLTPREAARIQSFPDWFEFPVPRTHQFKLIGNAVPPLVAKAVGKGVWSWLKEIERVNNQIGLESENFSKLIIDSLIPQKDIGTITTFSDMETDDFLKCWYSISYYCFHLHPDSINENLKEDYNLTDIMPHYGCNEKTTPTQHIHIQSGWPLDFIPLVLEAQKRLKKGSISLEEYYCSDIRVLGYRNITRGIYDQEYKPKSNTWSQQANPISS